MFPITYLLYDAYYNDALNTPVWILTVRNDVRVQHHTQLAPVDTGTGAAYSYTPPFGLL